MKKLYVALAAGAVLGFGSVAIADGPVKGSVTLTDIQMDEIVAGSPVKYIGTPNNHISIAAPPLNGNPNGGNTPNKVASGRITPGGYVCISIGGNSHCT
jgi:hypothetical protein